MILKFNNGRGAILCDSCKVIIQENFHLYEWKALIKLAETEGDWFCKKCSPVNYAEQERKFVEQVSKLPLNS